MRGLLWLACVLTLAGTVWRAAPRLEIARATSMLRAGQAERALAGYDRVTSWTLDPAVLHINAARALLHLERYDEAAARFRLAASQSPLPARQGLALFGIGNAHALAGRYADAAEAYKASLRVNPHDDDARFNLAWVLARLGPPDRRPEPGSVTEEDLRTLERLKARLQVNAPRPPGGRPLVDDR